MEKAKYNMWKNSAFILRQAQGGDKRILWLVPLLAALTVASNVLGLLVTPAIIEAVESRVALEQLIATIMFFVAALMLTGGARAFVDSIASFPRMAVRIALSTAAGNKMNSSSYPNTENQDFRKMYEQAMNHTMGDAQSPQAIWGTFTDILSNFGGFSIYLLLLSSFELWIIAVVLATTLGSFLFVRHINSWGYRHRAEEAEHYRHMRYITNKASERRLAKDIRIFGMAAWLEDVYDSTMDLYHAFIARREKVYIWGNVIDVLLTLLRNGVAYIYLIYMVVGGDMPASMFLLYFTAIGGLTQWLTGILNNFSTLHIQTLDISSIREFLDYKEVFKLEGGVALEPQKGQPYELTLRGVSFRHPGTKRDLIKDLDLHIPQGEKLAIVGLNGAGKTTLIKLLCGFYDPDKGAVLLNGEDIKQYNRWDYYRHFSAVFQDFSILSASAADNVSQSFGEADIEAVKKCVDLAGLKARIESLPKQYHHPLGREIYDEGVELSGGETQRLMLARALYKDAPIIILDEPTAALDPIAERDIYQKYDELCGGKTAIYISHRLASTRFCDRIILVEDGAIAEEGTHESLLAAGGKYAELFEIQSHYYREDINGEENNLQ